MITPSRWIGLAAALALMAGGAHAQSVTYELSDDGRWSLSDDVEPGTDRAEILRARRLLADGRPDAARAVIDTWLLTNDGTDNPWIPDALLTRGDAFTADGDEYKALFDYERLVREYPVSDLFAVALEREFDIGRRYLAGMRRKIWGLRIEPSRRLGEEILIRIQERLPGSPLAERAAFELADHYFSRRELELADEMYSVVLANFPESERTREALQRRVYANLARFKGPAYDASSLRDAALLIEDMRRRYPAEAEVAGINGALANRVDESAAEHLLDSADWYLRVDDRVSARLTLRRVVRDHPQTSAAQRAIAYLEANGWPLTRPPRGQPDPIDVPARGPDTASGGDGDTP